MNYAAVLVSFACMFLLGGGNILLSATKEPLMAHFDAGLYEIGVLFTIRSAVCGLLPFITGGLSDKFGRKRMILVGCALAALYYFAVPVTPGITVMYLLVFLYGIAYSFIDPSGMAILFDAMDNPIPAMPFIQVFYALGSILAPVLVGMLLFTRLSWHFAYVLFALLSLGVGIFALFVRLSKKGAGAKQQKSGGIYVFSTYPKPCREGVILFLFALCNSAVNSTISNWSDIYVKELFGFSEAAAIQVLSFVQVGSLLGSLFMSWLAKRVPVHSILRLWPVLSLITMALAVAMPSASLFILCVMCTSFTTGCLFSNVVGYAGLLFSRHSGAATGAISSASAAGIALCSFIAGRYIPWLGAHIVFILMAVFGVFSAFLGQIINKRHKQLVIQGETTWKKRKFL